jgi:hypothetical protein
MQTNDNYTQTNSDAIGYLRAIVGFHSVRFPITGASSRYRDSRPSILELSGMRIQREEALQAESSRAGTLVAWETSPDYLGLFHRWL